EVGRVQVAAERERASSLEHLERVLRHVGDVLEQMEVQLDPKREGGLGRFGDVGREERGRMRGDLKRRQGVRIDKLMLDRADGRRDVRAIEGEAEHGDRETHLRIDECAYVAAHNGGVEPPRPIDDGGDASIDEAGRGQAYGGINLALGGRGPPDPARATLEPADDVIINTAPANEGLQGVIVRVDEAGHDEHPAPVDDAHPIRACEVGPHSCDVIAYDEDVDVLELSEDLPIAEVRIHGEGEGGVLNQIAAASDGRGLLARVALSTITRRHDSDDQCQEYPD